MTAPDRPLEPVLQNAGVTGASIDAFVSQKPLAEGCPRTPETTVARHVHGHGEPEQAPDGARGPRGHRQPFSRRERRRHPFPWLDPPPRGCRAPRPVARNRGYSYPSGGRVRALQWILRPRMPPNRPQNAQNGRESGFPGSAGCWGGSMTWMAATQSDKDPPTGGFSTPRRSRPSSRLAVRRGSRRPGRRPRRDYARPVAPATGFGGWSTSPPAAPVAGRKRRGQRGRSPPPASAGDSRSVATRGKLLEHVAWLKPAGGTTPRSANLGRSDAAALTPDPYLSEIGKRRSAPIPGR